MTTDAPVPPTRRALRDAATGSVTAVPAAPTALRWVDDTTLGRPALPAAASDVATSPAPDLLARAPHRSPWRPGTLVPAALLALVVGAYVAMTMLWPLTAVAPQIESVTVDTAPAAVAAPAWPAAGSAAISVAGIDGVLTSSGDTSTIASITKVVTAMMVLDRLPLAVGESGPDYRFTVADRAQYLRDRSAGESALDVPVGGTLSEHQLLQGMLIGSANNYADRLAGDLWPSDAVFANAARTWLNARGISGITLTDPSGIDEGNTATPEALLAVAAQAMANPVIADIVGRTTVTLPGAGDVENTNGLLADPGVVGIKTGTLDAYNLLSAKDVSIGGTTARVYAVVLGQPDDEGRLAASRALYAQVEQELQLRPAVAAGTTAGRVTTAWGESVDVVTAADGSVVLWNGGRAVPTSTFSLGDATAAGDAVGSLTLQGPLDQATVELQLAADLDGPSPWWRLTHPLELLGVR